MAQLVGWNPALEDDCSNLAKGQAYCVDGPAKVARRIAATPTAEVEEEQARVTKRAHVAKHVARRGRKTEGERL